MNLRRILSFGLDPQTLQCACGVFAHPLQSGYRLCRRLAVDDDRERREMLQNLALGLPDRVAGEYREELEYLARFPRNPHCMFPYERREESRTIESGVDPKTSLPYVVHEGRRFFGPRDMSEESMLTSYRYFTEDEGLLGTGCRVKSPHSYTDGEFMVEPGGVVVDIGCSDGLFAFHHAEKASRIFLFESWSRWKPALEASFKLYCEKTVILDKFVTDHTDGANIRLSDAVNACSDDRFFIKMDIEGGERKVIEASRDFLMGNRVKLSCCAYHRQDDAEVIVNLLRGMGFSTRFSEGYMLPLVNGIHFPYFRHGVVYAQNY